MLQDQVGKSTEKWLSGLVTFCNVSTKVYSDVIFMLYNFTQFIFSRNHCDTLGENLGTTFAQIPLLNYIDSPTSWPVKVGWKSHMKIGFSHATMAVGYTTFGSWMAGQPQHKDRMNYLINCINSWH